MAYNITHDKAESQHQLSALVAAFQRHLGVFANPAYSEAQLRIDFINPLLRTLGWGTDNEAGMSQFLREVTQEEAIDVAENDNLTKKT